MEVPRAHESNSGPNQETTMSNPKNLVDYDVRVRDRNVKSGLLRKEDVDRYVAALPDVAPMAQPVDVIQPGTGQAPAEEATASLEPTD
jgi:hypothetical protein